MGQGKGCSCGCNTCDEAAQKEGYLMRPKKDDDNKPGFRPDVKMLRKKKAKLLLGMQKGKADGKDRGDALSELYQEIFGSPVEEAADDLEEARPKRTKKPWKSSTEKGKTSTAKKTGDGKTNVKAKRGTVSPKSAGTSEYSPFKSIDNRGLGSSGSTKDQKTNNYVCRKDPKELGINSRALLKSITKPQSEGGLGTPKAYKSYCINKKRFQNLKSKGASDADALRGAIFVTPKKDSMLGGKKADKQKYNDAYWDPETGCVPMAGREGLRGPAGQFGRPNCYPTWQKAKSKK